MRKNPCQKKCMFDEDNLCLGCGETMFDITELERDRGPLDKDKPSIPIKNSDIIWHKNKTEL